MDTEGAIKESEKDKKIEEVGSSFPEGKYDSEGEMTVLSTSERRWAIKKLLTRLNIETRPEVVEQIVEAIIWLADRDDFLLTQMCQEPGFGVICQNLLSSGEKIACDGDGSGKGLLPCVLRLLLAVSATRSGPHYLLNSGCDLLKLLCPHLTQKGDNGEIVLQIFCNLSRSHAIGRRVYVTHVLDDVLTRILKPGQCDAEFKVALQLIANLCANPEGASALIQNGVINSCFAVAESKWKELKQDDDALKWLLLCFNNVCQIDDGRELFCARNGSKLTSHIMHHQESMHMSPTLVEVAKKLQGIALGEQIHTELWEKSKIEMKTDYEKYLETLSRFLSDEIESHKLGKDWSVKMNFELHNLIGASPIDSDRWRPNRETFVKGTEFKRDSAEDIWTIVSEITDVHQMKKSTIQQSVSAALNSKMKLRLVFGVSTLDNVIEGIHMDSDDRDLFRIGVDAALTKGIRPSVPHDYYDVDFIPVVNPGDSEDGTETDLFAVRIRIDVLTEMHYQLINGQLNVKTKDGMKQVSAQEFLNEFWRREIQKRKGN